MNTKMVLAGRVITPDGIMESGIVTVMGTKIVSVTDAKHYSGCVDIHFGNGVIGPGFIDIHIHGGGGNHFMSGDVDEVLRAVRYHAKFGTTGLLPTTVTASSEEMALALQAISAAQRIQTAEVGVESSADTGAKILGVHVEGPYISPKMAGGQEPRWIRSASLHEFLSWRRMAPIRMLTIAPEVEGARELIQHVSRNAPRVVLSAGHTDATYAQIMESACWGIRHLTHFCNAMRGLHHREPGVVGAGLLNRALTVELIADGVHVHREMLRLVYEVKGSDGIILVTDSAAVAGLPDGVYDTEGRVRKVENGTIRLLNGTLAGSGLTMNKAVQMMTSLGVPIQQAWKMASWRPAILVGLGHCKGKVESGFDADLTVVDERFNVICTMVNGHIVYRADSNENK
ncbi:MAG: N-acetylglucosamine-6-phosphate deacetylase [Alicyclobacillus sp.]|nr:N-acetylglucosamine-6-phosphate deacetylase [Alicyclobacillus sp.]